MDTPYSGCNFSLSFVQVFYSINAPNQGVPMRVQVQIQLDGGQFHDWITTPDSLSASKLNKAFFDLFIDPNTKKKLNAHLRQDLSAFLLQRPYSALLDKSFSSEKPGIFLSRTGWQRLPSGSMVFAAGCEIIGDPLEDILLEQAPATVRLPLSTQPVTDVPQKLLAALTLEPIVYPAIWTFTLTTAMLSFISQPGIHFQAIEYLIGRYGTGKSTVSEQLFALYDNIAKPGQAALMFDAGSSSPALTEILATFQDLPVVLDDFCSSGDRETVRLRRRTTAKILRIAANKTSQIKGTGSAHKDLSAVAGLAVTAELGLDSESEWSRFFPICFKHGMKPLTPETRGLAAEVLRLFLSWVAPQYHSLQDKFRADYSDAFDTIMADCPRTSTTFFVLTWIARLFCQFCQEQCSLTKQDHEKLFGTFRNAIQTNIRFQLQQIALLATQTPKESIPYLIVKGIENGNLSLCSKPKQLRKKDGLRSDGRLYLWPNVIHQFISQQTGYQNCTKLKISKVLKGLGILLLEYEGAEDNTVHLEVDGKRCRFLCLDEKALYKEAKGHSDI